MTVAEILEGLRKVDSSATCNTCGEARHPAEILTGDYAYQLAVHCDGEGGPICADCGRKAHNFFVEMGDAVDWTFGNSRQMFSLNRRRVNAALKRAGLSGRLRKGR